MKSKPQVDTSNQDLWSRRHFVRSSLGGVVSAAAAANLPLPTIHAAEKQKAAEKLSDSFRIFYTWDMSDPPRYHHKQIDGSYFDWLFAQLEGTGLTFLFRCNLAGRAYYHSKLMNPFDESAIDPHNPKALKMWRRVLNVLKACDPLAEAVRAGRKYGVPVWAWSNWNELQSVRQGWLELTDPVWYQNPRKFWCTRDGSRFYHGVPDWGDEDVRKRFVGLAEESMGYGVEGFYLSSRTHSWNTCWPTPGWADGLEPFGFNDSVVAAYRERYGVDIRYEDFDKEKWHHVKGDLYSELLALVGAAVHKHDKPFILGIKPDRDNVMVLYPDRQKKIMDNIQLYKNWERWVAEGSVDGICAEQPCPHSPTITGGDISLLKETLPSTFPLYSWADTATWVGGIPVPFSLHNWNRHSVEDVLKQIQVARTVGAKGIVLHSLYHYTAVDSAGAYVGQRPAGYGAVPRTEYLDALRNLQG